MSNKQTKDVLGTIANWPVEAARCMGFEASFRALRTLAKLELQRLEKKPRERTPRLRRPKL